MMLFRAAFLALLAGLVAVRPAYAAEAGQGWGESMSFLVPLVAMAAIFYFLIIRPQNKRLSRHRDMVANLKRGDVVITAGGLVGKIHRIVDEQECFVELTEGVRVRVVRATISQLRQKDST